LRGTQAHARREALSSTATLLTRVCSAALQQQVSEAHPNVSVSTALPSGAAACAARSAATTSRQSSAGASAGAAPAPPAGLPGPAAAALEQLAAPCERSRSRASSALGRHARVERCSRGVRLRPAASGCARGAGRGLWPGRSVGLGRGGGPRAAHAGSLHLPPAPQRRCVGIERVSRRILGGRRRQRLMLVSRLHKGAHALAARHVTAAQQAAEPLRHGDPHGCAAGAAEATFTVSPRPAGVKGCPASLPVQWCVCALVYLCLSARSQAAYSIS